MGDCRGSLPQPHSLQGVTPQVPLGSQGEGPDLLALQLLAYQPEEGGVDSELCCQPCSQGVPQDLEQLDPDLASHASQDRDRPQHPLWWGAEAGAQGTPQHLVQKNPGSRERCFRVYI